MTVRSLFGSMRGCVRAIVTNRPLGLHACDHVGPDVKLHGHPSVTNRGLIAIGAGAVIWSRPVRTQLATGNDGALHVGPGVTVGHGSSISAEALVMIGEGAKIGPFCTIFDTEDDALSGWGRSSRPVVIGRDARIGSKVTILPGTSIGDRAEIGPGSVVSGLIPADAKASGVPARVESTQPAMEPLTAPRADLPARVHEIVARVFDRSAPCPPSLELERLSGWGGEGALRLLVAIEDAFEIDVPANEWLDIRTLADLVALVERCAAGASARPTRSNSPPSTVG